MDNAGGGRTLFSELDPATQAEFLAVLAQDARLLRFSLEGEDAATRSIGARLQRALENALDAGDTDEAQRAREELEQALTGAREAGLRLSARLGELDVDGLAGSMKMRVLATVLAPAASLAA